MSWIGNWRIFSSILIKTSKINVNQIRNGSLYLKSGRNPQFITISILFPSCTINIHNSTLITPSNKLSAHQKCNISSQIPCVYSRTELFHQSKKEHTERDRATAHSTTVITHVANIGSNTGLRLLTLSTTSAEVRTRKAISSHCTEDWTSATTAERDAIDAS